MFNQFDPHFIALSARITGQVRTFSEIERSWTYLLPQVRLSLLDSGHNHVTNASRRKPVQAPLDSLDGDDVQAWHQFCQHS